MNHRGPQARARRSGSYDAVDANGGSRPGDDEEPQDGVRPGDSGQIFETNVVYELFSVLCFTYIFLMIGLSKFFNNVVNIIVFKLSYRKHCA